METHIDIAGLMKTNGFTKYECITNLRLYTNKMEKILSLIEDKLPLSGPDIESAQLLLKDLKQSLQTELDRGSTGGGQKRFSVEHILYMRAIHEVVKRISLDIGLTPNQRWIDEIDVGQKYIKQCLNQLLS